jgi:hypothetical protein
MDKSREEQARKLAKAFGEAGPNSGLLLTYVKGHVVLRSLRSPCTDTPLPSFELADLHNAVSLGLLQKGSVAGSSNWDWWMLSTPVPKRSTFFRHMSGWLNH